MRPKPLKAPKMPTRVAAAPAVNPTLSWARGDATEIIAIPHVILIKSISHK